MRKSTWKIEYLEPIYDSCKSFYQKAYIETDKKKLSLYSYNTLICTIKNNKIKVFNMQSATTIRHLKEFLSQNDIDFKDSKDIKKRFFMEGSKC